MYTEYISYCFKTFYIYANGAKCIDQYSGNEPIKYQYEIIKHNYTHDQLFAIKHNQLALGSKPSTINPAYLRKTHSKFEEICEREYKEIDKLKNDLAKLIQEHIDKKEYYESLETKISNIKLEKQYIDDEKLKIEKQKQELILVKTKLLEMKNKLDSDKDELARQKQEIELEKDELARQKNRTLDFNKCFEDILKN